MILAKSQLQSLYARLQFQPDSISEEDLLVVAYNCRLDARLCEITIDFLLHHYWKINPFKLYSLREYLQWPQVLAVLLDFVVFRLKAEGTSPAEVRDFLNWSQCVTFDLSPAPLQRFFVRAGRLQPERDLKLLSGSLNIYLKWGFFESENLISQKADSASKHLLISKPQRLKILKELLNSKAHIQVNDYIQACDGLITRRTAERDLHSLKGIQSQGNTNAKVFWRKAHF